MLLLWISISILLAGGIAFGQVRPADEVPPVSGAADRSGIRPGASSVQTPVPDEVEAAFDAYRQIGNFEKLEKYPGLSDADFRFSQTHYAPPIKGVIIDTNQRRAERVKKISETVFRLHGAERQCAVVVLDSRLPTVFTWKMTFVSLTTRDLELLDDEELTALVAHEVGHLYFAADLSKARESADDGMARVAELKCDLIALETLRRLAIKPESLATAVEKLVSARRAMNVKSFDGGSPTLEDRRRLIQIYTERTTASLPGRKSA